MYSALTHLECTACGATWPADALQTVCPRCGKVLGARYDLVAAARTLTRAALRERPFTLWRYHEVLPVRDPAHVVTLAEGGTPLLPLRRYGAAIGLPGLLAKDEGRNPTGSFKARGLSVAVSRARELGARALAAPSTGNAGLALAAYAARAGLAAHVFLPREASPVLQGECLAYGAHLSLVDGLLTDAGRISRTMSRERGWFDVSTLREPYRVEGKKTMGYELAEQLGWAVPDAIVYPTGGGTGVVGLWKAFAELEALGFIGPARPRLISVQAAGCAPLVRAFASGEDRAAPWGAVTTAVPGLRAPATIGDYLILRILRASGGTAVTVTDEEMRAARRAVAREEGLYVSLESAATYAAAERLAARGYLRGDARVVALNTAGGAKQPDTPEAPPPLLDPGNLALDE
ncbi:MAG TPA: threonine synthase [Thermomicrobiales bacterium]|nr:threonine synthase [Thermomicrobiales bacterium]